MTYYNNLLTFYKERWYATRPQTSIKSIGQQGRRSRGLKNLKRQISQWIKTNATSEHYQDPVAQKQLKNLIITFMDQSLDVPPWVCELLDQEAYYTTTEAFIKRVHLEAPDMVFEDIVQALRNLWVLISLQLYMDCPLQLTNPIYGYSMLYPLTDNYLDNPSISIEDKRAFNQRFYQKIAHGKIKPCNTHEAQIFHMIDLIHETYPREAYPEVTNSLLAILDAQNKSLNQQDLSNLYEVDLLAQTFYKGGTSVLADAYLINGQLTENQAQFAYGYGVILQLADDLQDLENDLHDHHSTMMTTQGTYKTLDDLTKKYLAFIDDFFNDLYVSNSKKQAALKQLLMVSVELLLFSATNQQTDHYSKHYIKAYNKKSRFNKKSFNFLNNRLIQQIKTRL